MERPVPTSERSLAVLNVGNTRLTMASCQPARHLPFPDHKKNSWGRKLPDLEHWQGFSHTTAKGSLEPDCLAKVLSFVDTHNISTVVMVSVVPAVSELLKAAMPDLLNIDHTWPFPFTNNIDDLAAVGADRLVNVTMARAWGLQEALIVDAGTATTFDLLDQGVFCGGLIAPGMAFAAQKLGEYAARLAPVPFEPFPLEVGRNSHDAMGAGAWHTAVGGVRSTIAGLLEVYGNRPVVFTGGLGHLLATEGDHLDPFWTLRGAAWLYQAGIEQD